MRCEGRFGQIEAGRYTEGALIQPKPDVHDRQPGEGRQIFVKFPEVHGGPKRTCAADAGWISCDVTDIATAFRVSDLARLDQRANAVDAS